MKSGRRRTSYEKIYPHAGESCRRGGIRSLRRRHGLRFGLLLALLVCGTLTIPFLAVQPAAADTWTETTAADFGHGTLTNLVVEPSGGLRLGPSAGVQKQGVVLDIGPPGSPDSVYARFPFVIRESDGSYKMWYSGFDGGRNRIMFADSSDGVRWTKHGVIMDVVQPPYYFDSLAGQCVLRLGTTYHMWFTGGYWNGGPYGLWGQVYHATSSDGVAFSVDGVALGLGAPGAWDAGLTGFPSVIPAAGGGFRMYYTGWAGVTNRIGLAFSDSYLNFTRYSSNPIIDVGPPGSWDPGGVFASSVTSPSAGHMYYSGWDGGSTNRIGLAESADGDTWTNSPGNPVMTSDAAPAFDSRAVDGASYFDDPLFGPSLYYAGYDGNSIRIGLARLTPPNEIVGSYVSRIFDSGASGTTWRSVSWIATTPANTSILISLRSGDSPTPDTNWTNWSSVTGAPSGSPPAQPRTRYIQYRAELATTNASVTPLLDDVTVTYSPNGPPTISVLGPMDGTWVVGTRPTLSWTLTDPDGDSQSAFEAELSQDPAFASGIISSGAVPGTATTWEPPALTEGNWHWRVRSQDTFGAWGEWVGSDFRVDTTSPTLALASPAPNVYVGPQVKVQWTASDPGSGLAGFLVGLDTGPPVLTGPSTFDHTFADVSDGTHTATIAAIDRAGNVQLAFVTFKVDATRPQLAVISPQPGSVATTGSIVASWITLDGASGLDRIEVRLDGGASVMLSTDKSSYRLDGVPDGTHTLTITAFDKVGNAQSVSVDFRVDTNYLSPSGPLGMVGPGSVIIAIGAAIAGLFVLRSRRRARLTPPPPGESGQVFK